MQEVERPSRPVLFFSPDTGYPYWGVGSSVFVASDANVYWLTARHVIENQNAATADLMITPTDESSVSVPFSDLFRIKPDVDNPDHEDLHLVRLNLAEFSESRDSELYAWRIDRDFYECSKLMQEEELFILGFPSDKRFVDYESKRIHFTQVVIRGLYEGQSLEDHCHRLKLETSIDLSDLDGFSGGTVFRHPRSAKEPSTFVGLALRGSVESGFMHFVDCAVVADFVRLADAA